MNLSNKIIAYQEETNGIVVTVTPKFYREGSNSEKNLYIWLYHIRIENNSEHTIKILARDLQIFDMLGVIEEVSGAGVIGQEPVINPTEIFEYTSQVRLFTPSGLMKGYYQILDYDLNQKLLINIPTFSLDIKFDEKYVN